MQICDSGDWFLLIIYALLENVGLQIIKFIRPSFLWYIFKVEKYLWIIKSLYSNL